jgi:hypothetical protein
MAFGHTLPRVQQESLRKVHVPISDRGQESVCQEDVQDSGAHLRMPQIDYMSACVVM